MGGVGGQQYEWCLGGGQGVQFGDGYCEVGQYFQQQVFDFDVGFVGFIDQQYGGFGVLDSGQQWMLQQEFFVEYIGFGGFLIF